MIKEYSAFSSRLYKLLFFVVFPVLFWALIILICSEIPTVGTVLGSSIIFIYVFGDYWLLGGMNKKDNKGIGLLMCSNKGSRILLDAIIVDNIRIFIYNAITMLLIFMISITSGKAGGDIVSIGFTCVALCFLNSFMSIMGITVTRYDDSLAVNMSIAYVFCMLSVFLAVPAKQLPAVFAIVYMLLFILVVTIQMIIANKQIKQFYIDWEDR